MRKPEGKKGGNLGRNLRENLEETSGTLGRNKEET